MSSRSGSVARAPGSSTLGSLLLLPAVVFLAGCETTGPLYENTRVETSREVANVFVSAHPAIAWGDISEKLEPKLNLTSEQAKALAVQTTQVQVDQFASTFALGLALGLPGQTSSVTTALRADGTQETTGSRTEATGAVPASSGVGATAPGALAADLTKGPVALPIDASTVLAAQTALYQQAQILDNQISKSIWPSDYQIHLLTFQINLQPKRRDLAYDAYVDINLFPDDFDELLSANSGKRTGRAPVIVHPLIVSDALEATSVGRSIQTSRQALLQLSGVIGGVGTNAGIGGGSNHLESAVGLDKNSLVTVGRVTENGVRVRLGAVSSGSSMLALIPRSYNVSVVVLSRWADNGPKIKRLKAITKTHFVWAFDGKELDEDQPTRSRTALSEEVARLIGKYRLQEPGSDCGVVPSAKPALAGTEQTEWLVTARLELLRAFGRGEYGLMVRCLYARSRAELADAEEETFRRFLSDLAELQVDSRHATMVIDLKERDDFAFPDRDQLVLAADDGKAQTIAVLRGGSRLKASELTAALVLKDGKKLLPTQLAVSGDGRDLSISFPSVKKLDLEPQLAAMPLWLAKRGGAGERATYGWRLVPRDAESVKNPATASQLVITANPLGMGQTTLQIGEVPKDTSLPLRLEIAGADLRAEGTGPGILKADGLHVAPESRVTLMLGNLTPARAVAVTIRDSKKKAMGDPIILTVERVTGAAE